jgi:single-strand DNA-binding protein
MSNTTTLTGNLTRDPELRYTNNAKPVIGFGMAVNRRFQQNGEWQEQTSFFDITAWGDLAENAALSLHKGDRVTVTGRLEQRTWETDNGDKRSKVEIVATDIAASLAHAQLTIVKLTREQPAPNDAQAA